MGKVKTGEGVERERKVWKWKMMDRVMRGEKWKIT